MINKNNEAIVMNSWDPDRNQNLNMISFYVDPQWCGVLFSVYWKNEKGYLFTGGSTPQLDPLSATAFAEPLDVDWITFAGSVGLEIYHLSSSWAVVFEAAKVTGVLLLLGFGSLVGYKILKYLWLSRFSDQSEPPSPTVQHNVTASGNKNQLVEDVDNTDLNDVEGRYFGPDPAPTNHGLVGMLCMHLHKLTKSLSGIRKRNINVCLESFEDFQASYMHRKNVNEYLQKSIPGIRKISKVNEKLYCTTPPNVTRNSSFLPSYFSEDSYDFSAHTHREGSFDSTCSEFSVDFTLPESCENTNIINLDKLQQEIDKLKSNCQMMDEELETIKCNRNLPGLSSLMETNVSETNFATSDNGLQIHSAASETLKQQNARACFAGLYSLTTIQNSSSDLSDLSESGNKMVESVDSLDWDSPQYVVTSVGEECNKVPGKLLPQPHGSSNINNFKGTTTASETKQDNNVDQEVSQQPKSLVGELKFPSNDYEMTLDLEWDEDDLVANCNDGDENLNNVDFATVGSCSQSSSNCNTDINNLVFQLTRCKDNQYKHQQNTTNGNSLELDSPSQDCNIDQVMNISKYSKESGYLEWDEDTEFCLQEPHSVLSVESTPDSDVQPLSNSSEAIYLPNVQYVGSRTNIYKHALQVCHSNSQHGETLLKGFAEIPSLTGLQNLRQMHADSYCIIRATIFQGLLHHCPIPCGRTAFQSLSEAFNNYNFTWLQNWNFSTSLPYQGKEVLHGMRMCLHTLDNVVSVLSSKENPEETLTLILNSDRSLDIHVMEAVKLHLLLQAMKLYQSYTSGGNTPGFVESMFAQESCRTPKDFMYNHLQNVGKTTYLHELVMSLLGYTLNMKICVFRPALFETDQFINYFPQCNISSSQEVVLIEDEGCYSVLVK